MKPFYLSQMSFLFFIFGAWKLWSFFLFFCLYNKWKICWNCGAFSIFDLFFIIFEKYAEAVKPFLFVYLFFHNIWKICWTCEAFSFCPFVFQNISKLCGSRLFLFFISSSRKFTVDTGSGAAASKLPQPKIFPKQIGCGGKIFDQQKKYLTSKEKDPPTLYSPNENILSFSPPIWIEIRN